MPGRTPRIIDPAGAPSSWFTPHQVRAYDHVQIVRGELAPNPGVLMGCKRLTVMALEQTPVRMYWRAARTGRLHQAVVGEDAIIVSPAGQWFFQRWSERPKVFAIVYDGGWVEALAAELESETPLALTARIGQRDPVARGFVAQIQREFEQDPPGASPMIGALAKALLVHLLRSDFPEEGLMAKGGLEPAPLARVLTYIDRHLTEKLTLDELAAVAGLSPHHFNAAFRAATAAPPINFVMQRRIERAMDALATTDQSIVDIAYGLGFASHSHFTRYFKRATGMSPSEYRKAWREPS